MAVPKKKTSPSRAGLRRSHKHLSKAGLSTCSNCKSLIVPHRVCVYCGAYKGKVVKEVS